MFLCHKNQPSAMHPTVCCQYILAATFLSNIVYLVECGILSTFDFIMAALRCVFAIKINRVQCILCGQYILADRFLRNSGYHVERENLSNFGCLFTSKKVLRNLKNPKFAQI